MQDEQRQPPLAQSILLLIGITALLLILFRPQPAVSHTPTIAYTTGRGDIYLLDLTCIKTVDGCRQKNRRLFKSPDIRFTFTMLRNWSSSGQRLVFYQNSWGLDMEGFYLGDILSGDVRPLFTVQSSGDHWLYGLAAVSSDGRLLAFADGDEPLPQNLYVSHVDGNDKQAILSVSGRINRISLSPDGHYILYEVFGTGSITSLNEPDRVYYGVDIWLVNTDGTNPHLLAENAIDAAWSPDSSQIVYSATYEDSPLLLFTVRPDGSERKQLTTGPRDFGATWSPNGMTIAYISSDLSPASTIPIANRGGNIFLINPDGSGQRQLTTSVVNQNLVWSPDSQYLVYLSLMRYPALMTGFRLFLLDVKSGESFKLTFSDNTPEDTSVLWHP